MKFATVLLLLVGSFVLNSSANSLYPSLLQKLRNSEQDDVVVPDLIPEEDILSEDEEIPDLEEDIERPDEIFEESKFESRSGCSFSLPNAGSPQPLFLNPGTSQIYPFNDVGVMEFNVGQSVEMYCPSTYSYPSGKSGSQTATCVSGSTFKIGGSNYDFSKVLCSSWISAKARKTGASCNGGIEVETGFSVGSRFVKQLEICFDEELEVTRYVYYQLTPGSNYFQNGVARPNFVTAGFFDGKNVDNLYKQVTQTETINNELGGVAGQYIDTKTNVYLARGHMAAKADFVYGTEQRGTFLFLNAAPQWQVFNAGNWQRVEDSVRKWVSTNKKTVNCWTGVYGVTTLPNKHGVETEMYLDYDRNHNGLIPVPMLYFRVVIEPATKRGVVLIGVNNPHLTLAQIKKDYILCKDVSDKITWINWKKTDIKAGYSYACEVEDFAKKNPNLPEFDVTSLLY
ncbi:uncharacterized protein LOC129919345 [Episyrphus balteatus]|uniref:uncharacterized protein LOC129919345 n=1 Tax=Episyrphus balteatus TaxID=286459 RepID=UPI002485B7C7|nr:uncharacterized protein LOC129919345 [Episyrphus balteatus]